MALIWADGFDHYGTRDRASAAGYTFNGNADLSNAHPRTGASGVRVGWNGGSQIYRLHSADDNTMIAGFSWYLQHSFGRWSRFTLSSPAGAYWIYAQSDGRVTLWKSYGGDTLLWDSGPNFFPYATQNYFEISATAAGGNSSVELRMNNNVLFQAGGLNFGNQKFDFTRWDIDGGNIDADFDSFFDDFYVCDGTTARNNDFLGDIRCRTLFPDANGPDQDWAVTGAANAVDAVDNVPFDTAKYIAGAAAGDKADFSFQPVPENTAYCVGIVAMYALGKTDAGPCSVKPTLTSAGVTVEGDEISPAIDATIYRQVFPDNPATGAAWNYEQINALVAGVERTV